MVSKASKIKRRNLRGASLRYRDMILGALDSLNALSSIVYPRNTTIRVDSPLFCSLLILACGSWYPSLSAMKTAGSWITFRTEMENESSSWRNWKPPEWLIQLRLGRLRLFLSYRATSKSMAKEETSNLNKKSRALSSLPRVTVLSKLYLSLSKVFPNGYEFDLIFIQRAVSKLRELFKQRLRACKTWFPVKRRNVVSFFLNSISCDDIAIFIH